MGNPALGRLVGPGGVRDESTKLVLTNAPRHEPRRHDGGRSRNRRQPKTVHTDTEPVTDELRT